jgi:hypothetical protein
MRNDLLLMFGVPLFDSLGTDVVDAIRKSDTLTEVPAGRLTELARATLDKLREIFHKAGVLRNLIRVFSSQLGSPQSA